MKRALKRVKRASKQGLVSGDALLNSATNCLGSGPNMLVLINLDSFTLADVLSKVVCQIITVYVDALHYLAKKLILSSFWKI